MSKSFNFEEIISSSEEQKHRISRLQEASTVMPKVDMIQAIMETNQLDLDEKEEILKHVDEFYMSPTEKALAQIKRIKEEESKRARDEKIAKVGKAAKNVASKVVYGKDFSLHTAGGAIGGIFKGITKPFMDGWKDA